MRNALQTRILAVALALATLAVCVFAGLNLSQELNVEFPTDGVVWLEAQGGLRADRVPAFSPGYRAGIRTGDILEAINGEPTPRLAAQVRAMYQNGLYDHAATYEIVRPTPGRGSASAAIFPVQVFLDPADRTTDQGKRLIALVYLLSGCMFCSAGGQRPNRPIFTSSAWSRSFSTLFARRVSRGCSTGSSTGAIWLRICSSRRCFCISPSASPMRSAPMTRRRSCPCGCAAGCWRRCCIVPGAFLIGLQVWAIEFWSATGLLSYRLDQIGVALHGALLRGGGGGLRLALSAGAPTAGAAATQVADPGNAAGSGPVYAAVRHALSVRPHRAGADEVGCPAVAGLLPLTFSWAIVRYRLMDVDLIFKRGVTYTLATAALAGLYFARRRLLRRRWCMRATQRSACWGPIFAIIMVGLRSIH